jgi:peptidoglycan/LPS O-acetylase OafA/YrhL
MSARPHYATLDMLRGIAAIVVVLLHAVAPFDQSLANITPHGQLAVDFFFCLSGFVIAHAYERKLLTVMLCREFVAARLIRLYPLALIGLLIGVGVYALRTWSIHHQNPFTPAFFLTFTFETLMLPFPPIMGESWPLIMPFDPPTWTLFFEFLANFIYAYFVARLSNRHIKVLLFVAAVAVFVQAHSLGEVEGGYKWDALWQGISRVAFPFLCGLFLYRSHVCRNASMPPKSKPWLAFVLLGALVCPMPQSIKWIYESSVVVFLFPLLIAAGANDSPPPRLHNVYLLFGRLSFPVYILSYPLIKPFSFFARYHGAEGLYLWGIVIIEVLTAIAISFVILKLYDEPVRAWLSRKQRARKNTVLLPL